jgi:hypothetical protein
LPQLSAALPPLPRGTPVGIPEFGATFAQMGSRSLARLTAAALFVLASPGAASAAPDLNDHNRQWLPASDGASWTWEWFDSAYAQRTKERYTVAERSGPFFRLAWTTDGLGNEEGHVAAEGIMDFRRTEAGLLNVNWSSTPPPPQFPILCAQAAGCGNSLAGSLYMLIWGTRSPVLAEPLLARTRWSSLGGASDDVASDNRYRGRETVAVPAFPTGVTAARVESDVTQAGALGDPYGSGIRTVWWVYGVGPVKIELRHTSGEIGRAALQETSLTPMPPPPDRSYLPLNRGDAMTFRWRNSKHMRRASVQRFEVEQVVNGTARVAVRRVSGPIAVIGNYLFATRLDGVTNLAASTKSASRATFPMLPVFPERGQTWKASRRGRDFRVFGVTGSSKVLGTRRVRTPAGRLRALVVRSRLKQRGFPFGSGVRTSFFGPGRGLVKLVFRHGDGSVSTVERLR